MAYGDFKGLAKRTAADKVLSDKAFNIAKNLKYDGYQRGLASTVYKFFDEKTAGSGIKSMPQNQQLEILSADLADMQLASKFNKGFRFLLCVIDTFSKYAWVVPLKDEKGISIVNAFQSILKDSNRKPNKIWVDKGSEFCHSHFKKWLKDNSIEMYSTHNEGKSVVAERFIRTIKYRIYKYMTSISRNVYIDKLDDIVHQYNNKKT